jgi:CheY-like chemotaxis protein
MNAINEKRTVLVVEDDLISQQAMAHRLKSMGYTVVPAMNGQEAFSRVSENRPDVILMDIYLPDINGCTLTRLIQKNVSLKEIPVIAISSSSSQEDIKTAYKAGCMAYFVKPVNPNLLSNQLKSLLAN